MCKRSAREKQSAVGKREAVGGAKTSRCRTRGCKTGGRNAGMHLGRPASRAQRGVIGARGGAAQTGQLSCRVLLHPVHIQAPGTQGTARVCLDRWALALLLSHACIVRGALRGASASAREHAASKSLRCLLLPLPSGCWTGFHHGWPHVRTAA